MRIVCIIVLASILCSCSLERNGVSYGINYNGISYSNKTTRVIIEKVDDVDSSSIHLKTIIEKKDGTLPNVNLFSRKTADNKIEADIIAPLR